MDASKEVNPKMTQEFPETVTCGACIVDSIENDGGEPADAELDTVKEVNGWINEASVYEVAEYECPECGGTGSIHESGGRLGVCATPKPPQEPPVAPEHK
jgi:hypothetical protein